MPSLEIRTQVMASTLIYSQSLSYDTSQRILFLHSVGIESSFLQNTSTLSMGRKERNPSGFVEKLMMKIQKTGASK